MCAVVSSAFPQAQDSCNDASHIIYIVEVVTIQMIYFVISLKNCE